MREARKCVSLGALRRRLSVVLAVAIAAGSLVTCGKIVTTPPQPPPPSTTKGPFACAAGEEWCGGRCRSKADFMNDDNNCGRCNNSCAIMSESCTGGFCGCAAGYSRCMGSCVSDSLFISDNNNCGRCGNSCSVGESCTGGTCMKMP